jgi:hypothetical protein
MVDGAGLEPTRGDAKNRKVLKKKIQAFYTRISIMKKMM